MTPLRQHRIAALQLSGKGARTQEASVREVRLLAQFYGKSPDLISEPALQASFLHRKNVDGLAPASLRLCYSGSRFFSPHGLQRDWHTRSLIRAQTAPRLPAVLSLEEVRRLLTAATPWHNQAYFTTGSAWDSGSMQPSPSRSPPSMASASRARSTGGRAPKTGTSPCPKRRSRCYAPPGQPLGTKPGSFPPLGAINNTALRRPPPCVAPGSRGPSAPPHTGPGSLKWAGPSIPSDILTPPLCSQRAAIPGSSSAPWGTPTSTPRWSPDTSLTQGMKMPTSASTPSCKGVCHDDPA